MAKFYVSTTMRLQIFKRANGFCEYCKCPADFTTDFFSIEHIVPRSKGGSDELSNLAFACMGCNIFKSDKIEGIDPVSQLLLPLFNPRDMIWSENFTWDDSFTLIIGKSAIGRATIESLQLNRRQVRNLRRALIAIGEHPPK
jgi:hypothetical protein